MAKAEAGGEMAVVFADVSGSTQLYVQLGDAQAQETIGRALELFADVTGRYDGTVIKTIGDEIMCRFPTATRGFEAATEMQRELKEKNRQISDKVRIGIRVGLHWGEAVLQDGDIFGDAVNVAARVAAIAKRDQIVTTEQTVKSLESDDLKEMAVPFDRVALKGRVGEVVLCMVNWDEEEDATQMRTITESKPGSGGPTKKIQVTCGDSELQLFTEGKALTIGRSAECSLVVQTGFASRLHARVVMRRGKFVLIDESTNGTYVVPGGLESGAPEMFIKREEMPLPPSGVFSLGQVCDAEDAKLIHFKIAQA